MLAVWWNAKEVFIMLFLQQEIINNTKSPVSQISVWKLAYEVLPYPPTCQIFPEKINICLFLRNKQF